MAKMSITPATGHGDSGHAVTMIGALDDVALGNWLPETWPSGAGVEFGPRVEQRGVAANAPIQTFRM
jgi:hypothetical protein